MASTTSAIANSAPPLPPGHFHISLRLIHGSASHHLNIRKKLKEHHRHLFLQRNIHHF